MTLLPRLIIFNITAAAFVVWAWLLGYPQAALAADTSGISYAILALFGLGIAASFWRAMKVGAIPAMPLRMRRRIAAKAPAQNNHLSEIAKWLAMLGMFGTVVGLIQMALSLKGSLGGADNLAAAIAMAFEGYGVALVTTAVGIVTGAWIEVNALLIGTATDGLVKDTGEV
jgi:hypothetical protein